MEKQRNALKSYFINGWIGLDGKLNSLKVLLEINNRFNMLSIRDRHLYMTRKMRRATSRTTPMTAPTNQRGTPALLGHPFGSYRTDLQESFN